MEAERPVVSPAGRQSTVELLAVFRVAEGTPMEEVEAAMAAAARRLDAALQAAMNDLRAEVEVEDVSRRGPREQPLWPVTCDGVIYRDAEEIARAAAAAARQAGVPGVVHDATGRAFALEPWASIRRPFPDELEDGRGGEGGRGW